MATESREGERVSVVLLHLPLGGHLEPEVYLHWEEGAEMQLDIRFGSEAGPYSPTTDLTSLVANHSICNHGSNSSFTSVFQRVRAVRHPHLRRQF